MSFRQHSSLSQSCPSQKYLEPSDLDQIVDYLQEDSTGSDLHHMNDFSFDPKDFSKDSFQYALGLAPGEVSPMSHAGELGQVPTLSEPTVDWRSWFPETNDSRSSQESFPLPPLSLQSTATSERSNSFDQSNRQILPMSDLNTNDWSAFGPPEVVLSSPVPAAKFMETKSSPTDPDCKLASKPVGTSGPELRRAKNRTAASKCRAKQKSFAKDLQEAHEETSRRNAYLKRQERILRELVTSLRDCALQHDSTRCSCSSLHAFNKKRAEHIFQRMERSGRLSS